MIYPSNSIRKVFVTMTIYLSELAKQVSRNLKYYIVINNFHFFFCYKFIFQESTVTYVSFRSIFINILPYIMLSFILLSKIPQHFDEIKKQPFDKHCFHR